jgi:hypothetical protein
VVHPVTVDDTKQDHALDLPEMLFNRELFFFCFILTGFMGARLV